MPSPLDRRRASRSRLAGSASSLEQANRGSSAHAICACRGNDRHVSISATVLKEPWDEIPKTEELQNKNLAERWHDRLQGPVASGSVVLLRLLVPYACNFRHCSTHSCQ